MLKRPTAAIKWVIALSIPLGLVSFLPVASWVYAELCDYKFMVVVWLSGLQHGLQPDNLLLAGLAGGASAMGIPAFVAFALLPPKPLHGSARLARSGEIAKAKLYKAGAHSILLGRHRGKLLAFNGDLHPFLAAATGTGQPHPHQPCWLRGAEPAAPISGSVRARPSCWISRGRTTA